jgi:hypothetical protein
MNTSTKKYILQKFAHTQFHTTRQRVSGMIKSGSLRYKLTPAGKKLLLEEDLVLNFKEVENRESDLISNLKTTIHLLKQEMLTKDLKIDKLIQTMKKLTS